MGRWGQPCKGQGGGSQELRPQEGWAWQRGRACAWAQRPHLQDKRLSGTCCVAATVNFAATLMAVCAGMHMSVQLRRYACVC